MKRAKVMGPHDSISERMISGNPFMAGSNIACSGLAIQLKIRWLSHAICFYGKN
jgi:hypothetical protein